MTDTLRITFLLPGPGHMPVGGFKVVYEYANHLSRRGHRVTVVHPARCLVNASYGHIWKRAIRYLQRSLNGSYRPDSWFRIDPEVKFLWVPSLDSQNIPDGDVVIASAWQTAEWAAEYPASKGRGCYLIQHWEAWAGQEGRCNPEDRVRATWKAPLKKIVIAHWLEDIATELGQDCAYIPNGLDFERFGLDKPIEARNGKQVMMLYHEQHPWKGTADGLKALSIVQAEVPDLRVTLYGTSVRHGARFPCWIEYHRLPKQNELRERYNDAAIFISPAWTEGWPLPPAEAMLCGAALVTTDIGGHREYAIQGETALLSPAKAPTELAANLLRLIRDQELRIKLARQGNEYIRQFSWKRAVGSFEAELLKEHNSARQDRECGAPGVSNLHKAAR